MSTYYDNMNKRMNEDSFGKNAQGISEIFHEVLFLRNVLQTKAKV